MPALINPRTRRKEHGGIRQTTPATSINVQQAPQPPLTQRPITYAASIAACSIALAMAVPDAVLAQTPAAQTSAQQPASTLQDYTIPAGPLAPALRSLASAANLLLTFTAEQTDGKTTSGLQGQYSTQAALSTLLAGTGLQAAQLDNGGYVLRVAPVAEPPDEPVAPATTLLPAAIVHGSLDDDVVEQRMSLSAAKIIVGRDEIETFGDASMGEVIRRMPSISFGGPPGENNDARLRGLNKEYTQILIDGQPTPGRDFSIDQIPAQLVERIEIIRTTTANMDNQGIAGTVNIIMRKPPKERTSRWHVATGTLPDAPGAGTFGSAGLTLGDSLDNFRYQVDGVVQRRNGVRTKDRQDYNNGGATLTNRELDYEYREHDELGLSARLQWQLNEQDEFSLDPRYLYSREDKERDRLKKATLSDAERMDQAKTRQYLGLNGLWQRTVDPTSRYNLGFNLQGTDTQTDKTERKGAAGGSFDNLPTFASGNDDSIREKGFTLRSSMQKHLGGIHALDIGAEAGKTEWDMHKLGWKRVNRSDEARTSSSVEESKFALYAQDEILLGGMHVLTPGLRLESVSTRTDNSQAETGSQHHLQPSPSLHWLTSITPELNWRASVTRSIRRPKFEDLAGLTESKAGTANEPDVVGNPDLKPETAWGAETSLERLFAERRGVVSANLFYRDITDLIEKTIVLDADSGRYQQMPINTAKASTWGVELDGSYRFELTPAHGVTVKGNYSWMDSEVNDPATGGKRPINDQPQYIFNAGADYEYRPWKLKFGAHYNEIGRLQKVDMVGSNLRTQEQTPSRYLDLSASLPISKDLTLKLSALNALEAEKNRSRTTVRPNGTVALFEQEDESSSRSFQLLVEGRF
ncbi:TonB-dependent receptor [Pseudomonas sp. WS 5019]|nr:TonB-dependent receptor [Pseudomonas sp. WS 5019]NMY15825.1 TonB-dependent receptor [Pseudomonas sp. WS 5019]